MSLHFFCHHKRNLPPSPATGEGGRVIGSSLGLAVLLATLLTTPTGWAATPDQSQQLKQLRGEIELLQQHISSDKREKSNIFQAVKQADKQISRLSRTLRTTRKQLKKQRKRYHQTQANIAQLNRELAERKEQLSRHMRSGYSAGQQPALKLLLNQNDPAKTGRALTYYRYLTTAQLRAIDDTRTSVDKLSAAEERLRQETAKLTQLQQEQEHQIQGLSETKKTRRQLLAELDQRIQTKEQRLQHLIENEKQLTALLKGLAQEANARALQGKNLARLKGKLKWPTQGKLLHRFGTSRHQGDLKWQGVLIGGQEGQDIHAIAPGKIVFADWLKGYGLTLIIDHGHNYMSIYSHNQSLFKELNDRIDERELIASMGSSGGNNRQGLYFEIRYKGKPVNPARWCR